MNDNSPIYNEGTNKNMFYVIILRQDNNGIGRETLATAAMLQCCGKEWVWELEDEVTVLFEMEHSYLLCL